MHTCKIGLNSHQPKIKEHHHHHDHPEHDHEHHHHDHRTQDKKVLKIALAITFVTMIAEFVFGFLSNSLALISDALSSVAIIIGYVVIYYTSWYFIDIILALLVAFVIGKWAFTVLKQSTNTLMESSPLDINEVKKFIEKKHPQVLDIHDIHIWEITQDMYNMTAHILIDNEDIQAYEKILHDVNHSLEDKYSIVHVTLQLEFKK